MAVINNTASMASIGQKTPAQIAKETQTKAVTDTVKKLVAVTVDQKPASLAVGEVVKVTNDKGKVEYYVGTYDGKVSKPLTSVSKAVDNVNTQIKKAEQVQATALRTSQNIEIAETKQALKDAGLSTKEISNVIKAERTANTAELAEFKGLLAEPNLQYGTRDPVTNGFVASTTPTATPKSLLTYNDPVIAPTVQANIQQANDAVAEFQLLKGITQPFLSSGNTTSGVNPYAIYQALDNGSIVANKDANGNTTGYTFSPEVAAAKGDQSGLMDATGMSKASARALNQVVGTGTLLGDTANVTNKDGKYFVNGADGLDRYGNQNALVDTGTTDAQGNKIFAEVATDNSKKNKVSVVSNYVQQPDGTFKYGGIDSTDYTHIEGFDPIKTLAITGLSGGLGAFGAVASGLTGVAGTTLGGTIAGATGAALSGNNILKGGLLGALGGFTVGELKAAADAAGGYDNLLNQIGGGDFSSFTGTVGVQPPVDLTATETISAPVTDTTVTSTPVALATPVTTPTTGLGADMTYNTSAAGPGINLAYDAAGNIVDATTKMPFTSSGINLGYDAAGKIIDMATGLPFQGEGVNLINFDTGNYVQPSANTGSLLDTVKDLGTTAADALGTKGLITLGAAGIGAIDNLLTPTPKVPVYTSPDLNPAMLGTSGVTDWTQYYNNLFKRQGVGAGQYLGYDIMNRLGDIPPELMGLLGTSAQATPTTTTA